MVFDERKLTSGSQGGSVLKLFHSSVEAGARAYREHHHAEIEISFFKSGSGVYRTKDAIYKFEKGDIFLFGGDELHCITEIGAKEKMDLINLHFEPRFVWSSGSDMFDLKFLQVFLNRSDAFENRLEAQDDAAKKIAELILKTETELKEEKVGYEMFVKVNLLEILSVLTRKFGCGSEESAGFKASSLMGIERAMNYINENLSCDISLEILAKTAQMSRTYFCTVFKKLNGMSPWDYITIKRVDKSVEMIRESDKTMLEIAYACGFNNSTNFNRCFKKITGKTPGEYKR